MPAILPPVDLVNFEYVTVQKLGTKGKGQDLRVRRLRRKTTSSSFMMDFANNIYEKNGVIYPDAASLIAALPGSSFTRASTQTNLSATIQYAVNVPAIDAGGLLYEPTMTNLISQPSAFDNAAWIKDAGVTVAANADTAPDATLTADRVTFTNYFQKLLLNVPSGVNPALTYYGSLFAKQISGPNVDVQLQIGAGATVTPLSLVNWTRVQDISVIGATNTNMIIYDAGGLNPIHAYWGAQLEPNQLTSYHASTRAVSALTLVLPYASTVTYGDNSTAVVGPGAWSPNPSTTPGRRIKRVVKN